MKIVNKIISLIQQETEMLSRSFVQLMIINKQFKQTT